MNEIRGMQPASTAGIHEQSQILRTNRKSPDSFEDTSLEPSIFPPNNRTLVIAAAAIAAAIIAWAALNLANGWVGFAGIVPIGFRGGMEAAISLARLFAALVLILIAVDSAGQRLRWVAAGFVVLGLGQLVFGYVEPILVESPDLNQSLYEMILVRSLAGALIVVGLITREPPRLTWRITVGISLFCGLCVGVYWLLSDLGWIPQLVQIEDMEAALRLRIAPMSWMTGWHWALAALPFGLAVLAAAGALLRSGTGEYGGWLPLSLVLLAGSELHDVLWPSAYGNSVLMNTADTLRLAMAAVVVAGGSLELRRIASERTRLLDAERERVQRLEELTQLKADFTTMVAHELGHPLSAIRRQAEMISRNGLDAKLREKALEIIIRETDALDALVADVQTSAAVERDDFRAELRPVQLGELIDDAVAYTAVYPNSPELQTVIEGLEPSTRVVADPKRIGQVLRNLLCNAAKYSPPGTAITLRAAANDQETVRFEVVDRGPGIDPRDLTWIFEKFARGRNGRSKEIEGAGVGLYLSRRIVRAHGSDLTVRSRKGIGTVFAFTLKTAEPIAEGLKTSSTLR